MRLPWYWKIVGILIPIFLAVLCIFSKLGNTISNHGHFERTVNTAVGMYETENKKLDKEIKERKKEIATKLNQAKNIDKETLTNRDRILKASTMDELDALQKELGLSITHD